MAADLFSGVTPSERYLARLAKKTFLSLWSYANPHTDEGRKGGRGDGKELCDLVVVFGRHVLLFSDKHCPFPSGGEVALSWARWYRRAVEKSARQVLGARNFLLRYPDRVFLDRGCRKPFPLPIPQGADVRFHLFAVTRGAYEACRRHFSGGPSTGSLMINTTVVGDAHQERPFTIGKVLPNGPYIHVLDELTLEVVLREFDTIQDFITYLDKKEQFLGRPNCEVISTGEEQLVAMYATHLDGSGEHNFREVPADVNGVFIEEGFWEDFIRNPQYVAKKKADEVSYAWDRLIEHFVKSAEIGGRPAEPAHLEPALRLMAAETRLARRQLSSQLLDALQKPVAPGTRFLRVGHYGGETAYVFLILPRPSFAQSYEEYREGRNALLLAACKVARLRLSGVRQMVGFATEPAGTEGASEDLVVLDVSAEKWGPEADAEARELQSNAGILLDQNVSAYRQHDEEFPDVNPIEPGSPSKRMEDRALQRNLAKLTEKATEIACPLLAETGRS